jgi:hypothetical protein
VEVAEEEEEKEEEADVEEEEEEGEEAEREEVGEGKEEEKDGEEVGEEEEGGRQVAVAVMTARLPGEEEKAFAVAFVLLIHLRLCYPLHILRRFHLVYWVMGFPCAE